MVKSPLFHKIEWLPLYPLFLIAYPVLALVGININEVEPNVLWRPLILLVLGAAILLVLLWCMSKDWHRAAVVLVILAFLFFTYGHVYFYVKKIEFAGFILDRHRQMVPLWVGIGIVGIWWAMRKVRNPGSWPGTLRCVYYVPDNAEGLYPTITPVNTFRIILNKYFGQNYPMLEDKSFCSEHDIPYDYLEVPNDCKR